MIHEIAYLLLLQTAAGSAIMLRAMLGQPFEPRFYKIHGFIVLSLALLALVSVPRSAPLVPGAAHASGLPLAAGPTELMLFTGAFVAAYAVHLVLLYARPAMAPGALRLAMFLGLVAVVQSAWTYSAPLAGPAAKIALLAGSLLSAALLGAGLVGMLVGHWYLNDARLPWAPLEICATTYLVLCGAQAVAVSFSLGLAGDGAALARALSMEQLTDLFLWVRLIPGLLAPLVLSAMIRHTVRLRANMAATGLFYVSMILTACGEAFSRYLLVAEGVLL